MDVTFVLTHDCNLGCGYCYAGRKFRKPMSTEVRDRALDLAFSGNPKKGDRIQLAYFGGEPTLEWDLMVETARRARDRAEALGVELVQSVTTNGTLLDAARVRTLGDLGIYVALSVDGNREAHEANRPMMGGGSSWDSVRRGLDHLLEAGRPFETISVVTPESVAAFGASVEELLALGVPRVSINPCYEAVWEDAHLETWETGLTRAAALMIAWMRTGRIVSVSAFDSKIIARLKGGLGEGDKCALGVGSVSVAPSGNLYACERMVAEDESVENVIGHVTRGVERKACETIRSNMPDYHAQNAECADCAERSRCGAHCACSNLAETGQIGVAGGVQCWFERTTARLADEVAEALFAEKNQAFLSWFVPEGLSDGAKLLARPAPAHEVRRDTKKRLRVIS